jgi:CheY-like chemotaxis protein
MLIVEDEAMVSLMLEDVAADLGWRVAGTAYSEGVALQLLSDIRPTVAVIDVNLRASTSFGVSAVCRARGIPVLFVTGYTADDIPEECGDSPVLAKPFSIDDFARALTRCVEAPH